VAGDAAVKMLAARSREDVRRDNRRTRTPSAMLAAGPDFLVAEACDEAAPRCGPGALRLIAAARGID
jgi:hypothetical protein